MPEQTQNQTTQIMAELEVQAKRLAEINIEELRNAFERWSETFARVKRILSGTWANLEIEVELTADTVRAVNVNLGAVRIGVYETVDKLSREKIREVVLQNIANVVAEFASFLEYVSDAVLQKIDKLNNKDS